MTRLLRYFSSLSQRVLPLATFLLRRVKRRTTERYLAYVTHALSDYAKPIE